MTVLLQQISRRFESENVALPGKVIYHTTFHPWGNRTQSGHCCFWLIEVSLNWENVKTNFLQCQGVNLGVRNEFKY